MKRRCMAVFVWVEPCWIWQTIYTPLEHIALRASATALTSAARRWWAGGIQATPVNGLSTVQHLWDVRATRCDVIIAMHHSPRRCQRNPIVTAINQTSSISQGKDVWSIAFTERKYSQDTCPGVTHSDSVMLASGIALLRTDLGCLMNVVRCNPDSSREHAQCRYNWKPSCESGNSRLFPWSDRRLLNCLGDESWGSRE